MPIRVSVSTDGGRTKRELASRGTVDLGSIDIERARRAVFLYVRSAAGVSILKQTVSLKPNLYRVSIDEKGPLSSEDVDHNRREAVIEVDLLRLPTDPQKPIEGQIQIVLENEPAFSCTLVASAVRTPQRSVTGLSLSRHYTPGQTVEMISRIRDRFVDGRKLNTRDTEFFWAFIGERLISRTAWWPNTRQSTKDEIVQNVIGKFWLDFEDRVRTHEAAALLPYLHKKCKWALADVARTATRIGKDTNTFGHDDAIHRKRNAKDLGRHPEVKDRANAIRVEFKKSFLKLVARVRAVLFHRYDHGLTGEDLAQSINQAAGIMVFRRANTANQAVRRSERRFCELLPAEFWGNLSYILNNSSSSELFGFYELDVSAKIPLEAQERVVRLALKEARWQSADCKAETPFPWWPPEP